MIPMKTAALTLLLFGSLSLVAVSQQPEITPDTPVDTTTLQKWLHSGDPRLIAWAADFARRNHDATIINDIAPLLEYWTMPPTGGGPRFQEYQHRAVAAMLDALIQENAAPSISVVRSLGDEFPAQALILIKRIAAGEAQPTLWNWAFDRNGSIRDRRARAAAMLLAKTPDPSFVTEVVRLAEQHLTVQILSQTNRGYGGGVSSSCGDSMGQGAHPDWPVVYAYELKEYDADAPRDQIQIAQIGSYAITALRHDADGHGDCFHDLSEARFRHELIAYWLGMKPHDMPWQPEESAGIVWTTKAAYESELGHIVEQQRFKMMDTVERLHERDLLEPHLGREPRLVVSIECHVDPCPLR